MSEIDPTEPPPEPENRHSSYNDVADKIGFVPNVRKNDNLFQIISALFFGLTGAGVGSMLVGWPIGTLMGALCGFVVGVIGAGFVLMIVGMLRKNDG